MRLAHALELDEAQAPPEAHKRHTWELAQRARARDRLRGWNIARHPARLRIQTIDSLNAELTRRMPLLSKFGTQPGIAERPESLYLEAARRTLALLEDGEPQQIQAVSALLVHLDNDLPKVMQLIADMLPRRDQWLQHTHLRTETSRREDLERALREEVRALLADLLQTIPTDCREPLAELASKGAICLRLNDATSEIVACAELESLPRHDT